MVAAGDTFQRKLFWAAGFFAGAGELSTAVTTLEYSYAAELEAFTVPGLPRVQSIAAGVAGTSVRAIADVFVTNVARLTNAVRRMPSQQLLETVYIWAEDAVNSLTPLSEGGLGMQIEGGVEYATYQDAAVQAGGFPVYQSLDVAVREGNALSELSVLQAADSMWTGRFATSFGGGVQGAEALVVVPTAQITDFFAALELAGGPSLSLASFLSEMSAEMVAVVT